MKSQIYGFRRRERVEDETPPSTRRVESFHYFYFTTFALPCYSSYNFLMPTDTRLLYILSDLAYIAKLVPGKKAHDFTLSDFRQINGEFLDEDNLLENNLVKLFSKLEAGNYKLVLPDFLFTSTIVNLELDSEEAVKEHLNKKLLPELNINSEDYYLDTTVLSNYKGAFKVQLTALEKSVAAPLTKILESHKDIKIESISPLSWTSKSIISLEPSVAILQMGNHLFLAEHYIGVDQCYSVEVAEGENFAETVKTLKGVEPSLQTVYLLTNSLVDDAIKEKLKETLPVQQLADLASENESMPSYVRQIIEAGAKTFSIPEFLLPQFNLDKNYQAQSTPVNEKSEMEDDLEDDLDNMVKPVVVGETILPAPATISAAPTVEVAVESLDEEPVTIPEKVEIPNKPAKIEEVTSEKVDMTEKQTPVEEKEVDFSQFANLALDPSVFDKNQVSTETKQADISDKKPSETFKIPEKQVIKNQNDGSSVAKMILIGFISFVVTIALGVGIGLAYLQWTNHKTDNKPVVEVEPSVTPEVTPTPTPTIEINKADYKILVVNATTKAGYASTIANKVKEAKFEDVSAKNAKGIYEAGDYLLVKEDNASNSALLKELETATSLTLSLKTDIEDEDSAGTYNAVLVLGQ